MRLPDGHWTDECQWSTGLKVISHVQSGYGSLGTLLYNVGCKPVLPLLHTQTGTRGCSSFPGCHTGATTLRTPRLSRFTQETPETPLDLHSHRPKAKHCPPLGGQQSQLGAEGTGVAP
ncbi:hypothetical protein KIL84_005085 [Mauremys mutica]|uniref:Uncharacterized protein n=1 Tax=Mauremys mutica TaxID=74926 RepID=A0A9D3XH11_9SAUR|nr:hypothetical protein KIL84_005085 [Mauremys mutica]